MFRPISLNGQFLNGAEYSELSPGDKAMEAAAVPGGRCPESGGPRVNGRFGDLGKPLVCRFLFVKSLREEVSYVA